LRPVSSAARVGEHMAVVWNALYAMPSSASRSMVGMWTGPPNTSGFEKPASSVMKITMFGASSGSRCGSLRHWWVDSCRVRPATLADGGRGNGRIS